MELGILDCIKRRRSCRAYRGEAVPMELVRAVAEAGTYAPNACGEAWHFTVIFRAELRARINLEAKRYAAGSGLPWLEELGKNPDFDCLYGAPVVILVSCDSATAAPEADTAAATQNMLLAAESLGLGACWGYFATQALLGEAGEGLRAELGIPEGYKVYTSMMLGYPAMETSYVEPRKEGRVTVIE